MMLFDLAALFSHINSERQRRELSWAALSREVGVAVSTIRRFAVAEDAEADGVLALIRWLDVPPETYMNGVTPTGRLLPASSVGYVRVDMELVDKAQGGTGNGTRTRTTIQRLARVAREAGQPICSLTRVTEH